MTLPNGSVGGDTLIVWFRRGPRLQYHPARGEAVARARLSAWVPELSGVPDRHIHAAWLWREQDARQRSAPSRSAVGRYPSPIVDLAWARERVLAAFRAAARD